MTISVSIDKLVTSHIESYFSFIFYQHKYI